jgi:hypothetical protein
MRWRTYQRYVDKYDHYEGMLDPSWCRRGSSSAGRGRARAGSMEYWTLSGCGHAAPCPPGAFFDGKCNMPRPRERVRLEDGFKLNSLRYGPARPQPPAATVIRPGCPPGRWPRGELPHGAVRGDMPSLFKAEFDNTTSRPPVRQCSYTRNSARRYVWLRLVVLSASIQAHGNLINRLFHFRDFERVAPVRACRCSSGLRGCGHRGIVCRDHLGSEHALDLILRSDAPHCRRRHCCRAPRRVRGVGID